LEGKLSEVYFKITMNKLPKIIKESGKAMQEAIDAVAEQVAEEAKGRAPVESGELKDSIHVRKA
jgi:hypothetical protein